MNKLKMEVEGDAVVVATRHFDAEPKLVYRAHLEPELIQRWMLGPDGWTMPVCVSDARPGGKIRFEWSDGKGGGVASTSPANTSSCDGTKPAVRVTLRDRRAPRGHDRVQGFL